MRNNIACYAIATVEQRSSLNVRQFGKTVPGYELTSDIRLEVALAAVWQGAVQLLENATNWAVEV